jgi:hypothetical protein
MKEYISRKNKQGNTTFTLPIILVIAMIFIVLIGTYIISLITPFIWYEKLNSISQKYMFVIEKYGYLTDLEKSNLVNDLKNDGFNISYIEIIAPNVKKNYGELIEFKINYKLIQKNPTISNGVIINAQKDINISIKKYSYSKI